MDESLYYLPKIAPRLFRYLWNNIYGTFSGMYCMHCSCTSNDSNWIGKPAIIFALIHLGTIDSVAFKISRILSVEPQLQNRISKCAVFSLKQEFLMHFYWYDLEVVVLLIKSWSRVLKLISISRQTIQLIR